MVVTHIWVTAAGFLFSVFPAAGVMLSSSASDYQIHPDSAFFEIQIRRHKSCKGLSVDLHVYGTARPFLSKSDRCNLFSERLSHRGQRRYNLRLPFVVAKNGSKLTSTGRNDCSGCKAGHPVGDGCIG